MQDKEPRGQTQPEETTPQRISRRDFLRLSLEAGKGTLALLALTGIPPVILTACASGPQKNENKEGEPIPMGTPFSNVLPTQEAKVTAKSNPEPVAEDKPSPEPSPTPQVSSYPENDSGFSPWQEESTEAEARIRELGAGADVDAIRQIINEEFARKEVNAESVDWVFHINEQSDAPGWIMLPRDKESGRFWLPRITEGPEEGLREISGTLSRYLGREGDFFDLELMENPPGLGQTEQVILEDKSGWFPIGYKPKSKDDQYAWWDAKNEGYRTRSTFRPEGATGVKLQDGQWVGLKSDGEVGWKFEPTKQEWVEVETLPKRFDEPGLQEGIIKAFVERPDMQAKLQQIKQGSFDSAKSDFQLVIESYTSDPDYEGGFGMGGIGDTNACAGYSSDSVVVGYSDISMSHLPGWHEGDFVTSVFMASPTESNILVPGVFAIKKGEHRQSVVYPYSPAFKNWKSFKGESLYIDLNNMGGIDGYLDSIVGKLMRFSFDLYCEYPNVWDKEPDRLWTKDPLVKEVWNTPGNYIQRFTENPGDYLGPQLRTTQGVSGPYTMPGLGRLVSELDHPADAGGLISIGLIDKDTY